MLKALVWFLIFALVTGSAAYYFYNAQQPSSEEPLPVQRKNIHRNAHGSGLVEGNGVPMRMRFPFAGPIDDLDAAEGQQVKLNSIMARLNTTEIDGKIKLEEIALSEAVAKRDALLVRKPVEAIDRTESELKRDQADAEEMEAKLFKLETPAAAAQRQEQLEDAGRAVERAKRALALAEAELAQLRTHPTVDELAVASAHLEAAKLRADEQKQNEAAAAELRFALAEYDKVKRGANPADVAAAAARVGLAKTDLERAEADRLRLEKPREEKEPPLAEIVVLEKEIAQAKVRIDEKRAALEKLRRDADAAELRIANAGVERATETLRQYNQMKLGYELHAPFDALVTKRFVETGAFVLPNEDIFWVIDFTRKRVRAEFDVMALQALQKKDLEASIKSRAFGDKKLKATVIRVGAARTRNLMLDDPSQPKGGEVIEVELEFVTPAETETAEREIFALLRPGLRVEADIVLDSRADAICVPNSYVSTENAPDGEVKKYVYKVEAKTSKYEKPRKHEVKCGLRDEYYVEILEGLNVDDLVVKPKSQAK